MQVEKAGVFKYENALARCKALTVQGLPLHLSPRDRWAQLQTMCNLRGEELICGET